MFRRAAVPFSRDSAILHGDGSVWPEIEIGMTTEKIDTIADVKGSGPNDIWAGVSSKSTGMGILSHWDGSAWSVMNMTFIPEAIWSNGPRDVWISTSTLSSDGKMMLEGMILHWDGVALSEVRTFVNQDRSDPTAAFPILHKMWGTGTNDVWAVGSVRTTEISSHEVLAHWNGSVWSTMSVPMLSNGMAYDLMDITGTGPKDVWAIGDTIDTFVILHWNGSVWSVSHIESVKDKKRAGTGIWAGGPCNIWAVGGQSILRYH